MPDLQYQGSYAGSDLGMTGQGPDAPAQQGGGGDLYAALINLGSTIYASETARNNSKRTIKANKDLAEYSYSKDLEMWNRQNQYNDPSAQMARFANAGLNPNLIYGSGSGSSGNAQSMPKYNAPTVSYDYMPPNIGGALDAYQNFQMKQAQIDNVKAQTQNTQNRTLTEAARAVLVGTQGDQAKQNLDYGEYVKPYQAAILSGQARSSETKVQQEFAKLALMSQQQQLGVLQRSYLENNIGLQKIQTERQQAQLMFDKQKAEWAKMGITSSDNVMLRIFVRMLNESRLGPAFGTVDDMK